MEPLFLRETPLEMEIVIHMFHQRIYLHFVLIIHHTVLNILPLRLPRVLMMVIIQQTIIIKKHNVLYYLL